MSRIIVKHLPKNITEEKLRSVFGVKGTITDLQLKYTPDGKFRQFCFIGYYTEEEAENAIKFFNNTCIQTSRIKVEKCANLGSDEKPQSWSKYAKDSKINTTDKTNPIDGTDNLNGKEKKKKTSKLDEILGKHKDDPDFQEFLQVHDRTRSLWGNDVTVTENKIAKKNKVKEQVTSDSQDSGVAENDENESDSQDVEKEEHNTSSNDEEKTEKLAEKPISDLDYMKSLISGGVDATPTSAKVVTTNKNKVNKSKNSGDNNNIDLYTIKIQNIPYKTKRQDILTFFKPLKPYSVRLPRQVCGFCYVGFKTEKDMTKAMLKNKSFIKGKQVFFSDFTEKNKITKSRKAIGENCTEMLTNGENVDNPKWHKQKDNLRNEENISESGSIFFRNLPYTVTEENLQKVFEQFGPIAEIHLPVDTITRQIKGFGTVTFVMPEHAVVAFNKLDGTDFHGRLLHLIPGKSRDNEELDLDENAAGLTFKQKKDLKLKKTAQQASTWNTLFLGQNAVAEILSKQYGMSKEQILDTNEGGSSAAVRIALGETQIVIEMRKFLEEQGVHLNAFESTNTKRSKTIILAKNLPADTQIEDLTSLFAKFGPIGRLVLPPSGVTALIEFCDPAEARQAFKKLAFSKFKNVPLFLEWAPDNTFTTTLSGEPIAPKITEEKSEKAPVNLTSEHDDAEAKENIEEEDNLDDVEPEPNTTLFLRNLNFKTVLESVREHFKHLGAIHTIEIAKRKDPSNPSNWSSLGYGFIQFKKSDTAARALKEMQLTNIDGNQVELKRSDRILKSSLNTTQRKKVNLTKQTGTKILVRNIPFQAKVKEVREIFSAFGQLRSVRLPLKMTPGEQSHRGFGFVDYITKGDAKTAFEALSQSTHLYGRRLVLEWASTDDEDVNALRKRTASHIDATHAATAQKRSKKSVFSSEDIELTNATTDHV